MYGDLHIVEGGPLAAVAERQADEAAFRYLETQRPSCHSDTGERLLQSAARLEGCVAFSPSFGQCACVVLIARRTIFAIGFGMQGVAYRLAGDDIPTALRAGAEPASFLGAEWVTFQ